MIWRKVCPASALTPGAAKTLQAEDKEIAVFNAAGKLFALDNACAHRGGPLSEGRLDGCVVTCPWHAWQFDVTTGALLMNPATKLQTYPVQVKNGDVFVEA